MSRIVLTFNDNDIEVDAQNFKDDSCKAATSFMDRWAKLISEEDKPEANRRAQTDKAMITN